MKAEYHVLDSAVQHSAHLEELVAAESAGIRDSAACSLGGGLLLDDTVVADALSSGASTLALQLLSPPAALSTSGALQLPWSGHNSESQDASPAKTAVCSTSHMPTTAAHQLIVDPCGLQGVVRCSAACG